MTDPCVAYLLQPELRALIVRVPVHSVLLTLLVLDDLHRLCVARVQPNEVRNALHLGTGTGTGTGTDGELKQTGSVQNVTKMGVGVKSHKPRQGVTAAADLLREY